ncbi:hypothetical protein AAHA92_13526 [Salvia divinorum]|uniref:Uncharacterized protein n=1 Tax=Salvia divinorum TaxID=28513 RepID=A0ABD1H8J0_SALDI
MEGKKLEYEVCEKLPSQLCLSTRISNHLLTSVRVFSHSSSLPSEIGLQTEKNQSTNRGTSRRMVYMCFSPMLMFP